MDRWRFDALARLVSRQQSRRTALGTILGAVVFGQSTTAVAKRKSINRDRKRGKHDRQKRKKRDRANAPPGTCCASGRCAIGPGNNLQKCCFEDRDLTARNLRGANLRQASFARANLTAANFSSANLDQTCFVDANTTGTQFGGGNRNTAIFCRTETSSGIDNSGCHRGTPCCPTCDAAHPCDQDQVCCDGRCIPGDCCDNGEQSTCRSGQFCCGRRCVAGDCCESADCPDETCQRRDCRDNQCVYTPVSGEPGPDCDTVCCEDAQGAPVCCDPGVTSCRESGVCGCAGNQDCGAFEVCCNGRCVGGDCCRNQDCPPEICQDRACQDNVCVYTPVSGAPGPGCPTICCQDAAGTLRCCPPGTTTCDARDRCCTAQSRDATCGVGTPAPKCGEVLNNCGQRVGCGGCAERMCQAASCSGPDNVCVYTPVSGAPGPGCTTTCCKNTRGEPVCCAAGTTICAANGVCSCEASCECIGDPNRICSIFGTPCCPGMVCTPVPLFPLITNCQMPCETNQQCIDVFGPFFRCREAGDCGFIGKCCQHLNSLEAGASKVGRPRDGERFDALAKFVWAKSSRRTMLGTIASAALLGRPFAIAAEWKGRNGIAAGPGNTRTPRLDRG